MLRHLALCKTIAGRMQATYPRADLDDLQSAGTMGLMEAAAKFDPGRGVPFSGYAVPYIRNRIHDANRRRVAKDDAHQELPEPENVPSPPGQALDTTIYVHGLMDRCNDLERRVLLMYHWDGLTQTEISTRVGISRSSVSTLLDRAMAKLKV